MHESGIWELDLIQRQLREQGFVTPLAGRAFEIFVVLAEASGDLVAKDELMRRVWPGASVEDNTLHAHVTAIRRALGASRGLLKTVSGRGYTMTGTWSERVQTSWSDIREEVPVATALQAHWSNLPVGPSEFIGRSAAIAHISEVLLTHRAVTLTGPAGIGKTALAIEVARKEAAFTGGEICMVNLAGVSEGSLVPSAIGSTLGLRLGDNEVMASSVGRGIGDRRLLLILDACEHLTIAVSGVAETIVQICPNVTILATSREALSINGEHIHRVPPLAVPAEDETDPDNILAEGSVQLVLARLTKSDATFSPSTESLLEIATVCRHLDGIPLALELAAAQAATFGLKQVAARLNDRLGSPTISRRIGLPRHQTLHSALDWSYDLLPQVERTLLRRVSIFPSGFAAAAAASVISDSGESATIAISRIANLVAKSLVTFDSSPSVGRWRLLDTIRAYGAARLADNNEAGTASRLAAEYYRDVFGTKQKGSQREFSSDFGEWEAREIDNVRMVIDWAFSPAGDVPLGLELTASSVALWFNLGLTHEYRARVERALVLLRSTDYPDITMDTRLRGALRRRL